MSTKKVNDQMSAKEIKPEDIVMNRPEDDDDSDMPKPQTKSYKKYLKCSDRFMLLLEQCLGTLPYGTILRNGQGNSMRLIDFVRFIEQRKDHIEVNEMNDFIGYIAQLDFRHARPLMEVIENKEEQHTLWVLTED